MYLFRFMSNKEFEALKSGQELCNNSDHKNGNTNSKGFCFLRSNKPEMFEYDLNYAYSFLMGIASDNKFVVFFIPDEFQDLLKVGEGIYADPYGIYFDDRIIVDEYSITKYDCQMFKPIVCGSPNNIKIDLNKIKEMGYV